MKIRSNSVPKEISAELDNALQAYRNRRGFNVERYVEEKTALLKKYLDHYGLKKVVVAVSGGIDSAIVFALAVRAGIQVVPVALPSYDNEGVTGQDSAVERAVELCEAFGVEPVVFNITPSFTKLEKEVRESMSSYVDSASPWAKGQLTSYFRTPILYYINTLFTDNGNPSVLLGTTNYSEGSYLGYVGKASDGMVDIQLISDIYKSEVYKVARYLSVPDSLIEVTPTGDMFDVASDEEVFGASYDFVELFLSRLNYPEICPPLTDEAEEEFQLSAAPLRELHSYNKHKYLAGSPAVHLDLFDFPLDVWKTQKWRIQ